MRNKPEDMVNLLFEQMERLAEAEPSALDAELGRAKAMADVAEQVNKVYSTSVAAAKVRDESGGQAVRLLGADPRGGDAL